LKVTACLIEQAVCFSPPCAVKVEFSTCPNTLLKRFVLIPEVKYGQKSGQAFHFEEHAKACSLEG